METSRVFGTCSQDFEPVREALGHGNARAVTRIYAALSRGRELDGYQLVSAAAVTFLAQERWAGVGPILDRPLRMGRGFFLNCPPVCPMGPNATAFGRPGAGGSLDFADPERNIGFGYCTNFMAVGEGTGPSCEALVEALG